MKEIIALLNRMLDEGIIKKYAICGATALIYYLEPVQTQDVDILVVVEQKEGSIIKLTSVYNYLKLHGATEKDWYLILNNVPVQFLVPYNELVFEAMEHIASVEFGESKVNILSLEHLMAIMVQTGRAKDIARLEEIFRLKINYDYKLFTDLIKKYDLLEKWKIISKNL